MNNMYFVMTNGEYTFDERATKDNIHINDIVTFTTNKKRTRHYARVDKFGSNGRGVKITPLHFDGIGFIPIDIIIPGTKNEPYFKRDIRIIRVVV